MFNDHSSEKIVGRLPANLTEKQLVGLPTCGGFCDRSISFLDPSKSPCHSSQFQLFLISSVSLSSLHCSSFLAQVPLWLRESRFDSSSPSHKMKMGLARLDQTHFHYYQEQETIYKSSGCLGASFIFFLSLRFWPRSLATSRFGWIPGIH